MIFLIFYVIAVISAAPEKQVVSPDEALELFEEFIKEYNKQYDNKEKEERFKIFLDNLKEMNSLNERSSHATFGITQFMDLTNEEFLQGYTGYKPDKDNLRQELKETKLPEAMNYTVPDEFDWRSKGVVSRVKNQKHCGSCWAFSTTGNVESINAIKSGKIVEISEQQLLDCERFSNGCSGGYPFTAFGYLHQYGAMSSQSYPYKAQDGKCGYNKNNVVIKLNKYISYLVKEDDLKNILHHTGPLSIALAAAPLKIYTTGILHHGCGVQQVNHAVLLVGYGEENGVPYWLIKNSWGPSWGEDGYFRIKRGVNCLNLNNNGALTAVI